MNATPQNLHTTLRYFTVGTTFEPLLLALIDIKNPKRDIIKVNVLSEHPMPQVGDSDFMGTGFQYPVTMQMARSRQDVRYIGFYERIPFEVACRIAADFTRAANIRKDILDMRPATVEKLTPYYTGERPPLPAHEKREILCYR